MIEHTGILEINGDIVKVRAKDVGYEELAVVTNPDGEQSLAQVIRLQDDVVSLQVFSGGKGISTVPRSALRASRCIPFIPITWWDVSLMGLAIRSMVGPDLSTEREVEVAALRLIQRCGCWQTI
jgi:V/A-type H+-transporting ATPase subunit B